MTRAPPKNTLPLRHHELTASEGTHSVHVQLAALLTACGHTVCTHCNHNHTTAIHHSAAATCCMLSTEFMQPRAPCSGTHCQCPQAHQVTLSSTTQHPHDHAASPNPPLLAAVKRIIRMHSSVMAMSHGPFSRFQIVYAQFLVLHFERTLTPHFCTFRVVRDCRHHHHNVCACHTHCTKGRCRVTGAAISPTPRAAPSHPPRRCAAHPTPSALSMGTVPTVSPTAVGGLTRQRFTCARRVPSSLQVQAVVSLPSL
jgi:hypothetical protein